MAIIPPVTMVFCAVEGGKQYATWQRKDAREVHNELVAVMKSVLLQVIHIMLISYFKATQYVCEIVDLCMLRPKYLGLKLNQCDYRSQAVTSYGNRMAS